MVKIAWAPLYAHSLPEGHRFPMAKYELLPRQLRYEGTITEENLFSPEPLDDETILLTHDPVYWKRLRNLELSRKEVRQSGFPHSKDLIDREITIMQGTLQSARYALETGLSFNIAGGTHHAFADRGEGFCLLNDIAISANALLASGEVSQVMVIDLDVHQGNGTAALFEGREDVFTFSMHGGKNYPLRKERSDRDVELPDGIEDSAYLELLQQNLDELLPAVNPDLVFFQSGVDVLASDKLGRLGLSMQGCRDRDYRVFSACHAQGIPVQVSMGGGYSDRLADIVEAHANTFRLGIDIYF